MTDFSVQKIGRRDQLYAHKIGQSGPTGKEAAEARAQWAVHIPRDCLRIPCALKYTPEHSFSLAQIKFDFWEPLNLWNCQNLSKMSTVLYTDSVLLSHLWWVWIDRVWLEICPKSQTLLIQRHLWWTFDHILINFVPNCSMYALCEWSSEQLHSTGEVNTGGVLHLSEKKCWSASAAAAAPNSARAGPRPTAARWEGNPWRWSSPSSSTSALSSSCLLCSSLSRAPSSSFVWRRSLTLRWSGCSWWHLWWWWSREWWGRRWRAEF